MRPIAKGSSPIEGDFEHYQDAKTELVSRLGEYCSYCERRVSTGLAVEHIQPKDGPNAKAELKNSWINFLLACVNCNSCKGAKTVNFETLLFPDRDNTFIAYQYENDGTISISPELSEQQNHLAINTLELLGLDKPKEAYLDDNEQLVALDRASQRMEVIAVARGSLQLFVESNESEPMQNAITLVALGYGFFSIWMKVFDNYPQMKIKFIRAFKGTEQSGCFNMQTGLSVYPSPNPDALESGSKT